MTTKIVQIYFKNLNKLAVITNYLAFFLFLFDNFYFLDPDPRVKTNADPCGFGSTALERAVWLAVGLAGRWLAWVLGGRPSWQVVGLVVAVGLVGRWSALLAGGRPGWQADERAGGRVDGWAGDLAAV